MQTNIQARYSYLVLIDEQKIDLLMRCIDRPIVTSDDLGEQSYILRLTSYGHLSICAKQIIHTYCFNFLTSIDLW